MISKEIFRAYDIRGVVGETLTADAVYQIGRALGSKILSTGGDQVVIGRDGRLSGPELSAQLAAGLQASGCNVVDIGMVPTPVLYFATKHLQIKSAVMLTGSHNPVNYNGLKMIVDDKTIYGDDIQDLYTRICNESVIPAQPRSVAHDHVIPAKPRSDAVAGISSYTNVIQSYLEAVKSNVKLNKKLKIVIDCGNGVPGAVAPQLYRELGCTVVPLYCDVDGNFPNHHPDPGNPKNLQDLIAAVQIYDADLGLAFDGDGDRLGIVDNTGKIIWPDRALMLYADEILKRKPGATIIYDVKCSRDLQPHIQRAGGVPLMWNTGHSLIKAKMRETGAEIAAEMSGHIFIKDRWYGFDDALYAGARLLEIISQSGQAAAQIFAQYPEQVSTPEIAITVNEADKFNIMQKLIASAIFADAQAIITIDGVRVEYADGWGLLRPSNTTPTLVARFEACDQAALDKIRQQFRVALQAVAPELELAF